jgi:hypothetical protein
MLISFRHWPILIFYLSAAVAVRYKQLTAIKLLGQAFIGPIRQASKHCYKRFKQQEIERLMKLVCLVKRIYASVIVEYAVVQLIEVLIYKPEGHGFDSQSGDWNVSST